LHSRGSGLRAPLDRAGEPIGPQRELVDERRHRELGIELAERHDWFEPGARWSARRVLLHVIAETAQHAGHADILRETIDGAKTMG